MRNAKIIKYLIKVKVDTSIVRNVLAIQALRVQVGALVNGTETIVFVDDALGHILEVYDSEYITLVQADETVPLNCFVVRKQQN